MKLLYKNFYMDGEYIIKEQDPSNDNGNIIQQGNHEELIKNKSNVYYNLQN